jgi:two-component system chemotaxis response regulator CheY
MARILLVDGAAFVRTRCSELLGEEGYEVMQAANGPEALRLYKEQQPDAVLLDITQPKTDGIVTLREIIRMDPGARVAMISSMGQNAKMLSALQDGAMAFLVKPFDGNSVLDTVRKLIS